MMLCSYPELNSGFLLPSVLCLIYELVNVHVKLFSLYVIECKSFFKREVKSSPVLGPMSIYLCASLCDVGFILLISLIAVSSVDN